MRALCPDTNACSAFKRGDAQVLAVLSFAAHFSRIGGLRVGVRLGDFLP